MSVIGVADNLNKRIGTFSITRPTSSAISRRQHCHKSLQHRHGRLPKNPTSRGCFLFTTHVFWEKKMTASIKKQYMHRPMTKTFLVHFVAAGTANNQSSPSPPATVRHLRSMDHGVGSEPSLSKTLRCASPERWRVAHSGSTQTGTSIGASGVLSRIRSAARSANMMVGA
ncbi:MAG: hypothetical protein Ct9H300mP13_7450 [Gammaproteobacteria bacterium]|nr:MAG: hypothetical protein Ct9H300mP13_7450 [Gammaproteobacteria bacterium]